MHKRDDRDGWDHLSDSELKSRLVERGTHPEAARVLVEQREHKWAARQITEKLG